MKIGGSMGPLYGKFFLSIGKALDGVPEIGKEEFGAALNAALDAIHAISPAQVGDKTLMDVLIPADEAYAAAAQWTPQPSRDAIAPLIWLPSWAAQAGSASAQGA